MSKSSKSTKASSSTKSSSKGSKSSKSVLSSSYTVSTLSTRSTRTDEKTHSSEDEEELVQKYLETEKETLGDGCLISLQDYLDKHVQPFKSDYSQFATSYLLGSIPNYNLDSFHSGLYEPEPLPFKNPVIIKEFADKELSKKFLGESVLKPKLIPSSKVIWKEVQNSKFKTAEDRRTFLFFKARQWCEVNKALTIDSKYPKKNPSAFREKFSDEHQKSTLVANALKKKQEQREIARLPEQTPFTIPLELLEPENPVKDIPEYRMMAQLVQEEKEANGKLEEDVSAIFRDIQPLPELKCTDEHWQFKATKVPLTKPRKIKKPPFKRTEYPPKTKREKILELRKLLPGPKPLHLEEDMLSGIWEPELMIDEFEISPLKDEKKVPEGIPPDTKEADDIIDLAERLKNWEKLHFTKEKCKSWLTSIPD